MSEENVKLKRREEESAVKEVISWVITIALAVVAALFIKHSVRLYGKYDYDRRSSVWISFSI